MSSAADGGGREDSGEEADAAQDPDLAAMWQRFQHLTDKLSASNERSESLKTEIHQSSAKKREPHTPAKFASLELNELVTDSTAGAEQVDAVLASASDLESSNAVLPALLSLDALFEECLRPHPPLIAALARPDAITKMIQFAAFEGVDIGDHNPDRLAFASCKLLSCGWWGRTHGILDMLVSDEPLENLIEFPSRTETEPPMNPRASFFWARIMRTVLNEKHGEVLEYLRQEPRALVTMLSALAAHAASETEAGPLLWEMLTDEELAELAAGIGAGPHVAGSLVSSLESASRKQDDEAISVGIRLIVSMLELGHRISPHFRDAMVHLVPDVLAALSISDPARLVLSISDILLAVLSPNSRDVGSPDSQPDWETQGFDGSGSGELGVGARGGGGGGEGSEITGPMGEDTVVHACQHAVMQLLERFAAIGELEGTSLVRRRRRETSFQFTVMRPRGGARGIFGETASVADIRHATNDQAASDLRRPNVAMNSTARERRIAFAEEKERVAVAAAAAAPPKPVLRVGTADLATVEQHIGRDKSRHDQATVPRKFGQLTRLQPLRWPSRWGRGKTRASLPAGCHHTRGGE